MDPAKVDWKKVTPEEFGFAVKQDPGPENSIGKLVAGAMLQDIASYAMDLQGAAGVFTGAAEEEARVKALVLGRLPVSLRLNFVYCENIPRSAGGKFEDFISEVGLPTT